MSEVRVVHTADLGAGTRAEVRALLGATFEDLTEADWDNALGGLHALVAPAGIRRTPEDDDAVHVLPATAPLDRTGELTCDWREGDPW